MLDAALLAPIASMLNTIDATLSTCGGARSATPPSRGGATADAAT